MISTLDLARIANREPNANMKSIVLGLEKHPAGLNLPHRLAHYIAQIAHESGGFRYDREVWEPTPAQRRYEGRKDLGNVVSGDGYKFRGHTGIQITGRANTGEFLAWCRKIDHTCPDFIANPSAMNADPWEGLGPIWYWDTRNINALADRNDILAITKAINGGYNGLSDRKRWYVRAALVLLGHNPTDIIGFQKLKRLDPDGIAGPKTMAALHVALKAIAPNRSTSPKSGLAAIIGLLFAGLAYVLADFAGWISKLFGG